MYEEFFAQKFEAVNRRVLDLQERSQRPHTDDTQEIMQVAFTELQTSLEELHVAEAELRSQNEELMATRQQVEEERRRYQGLFEFAPDAYLITDANGKIREANRAAARMLLVPDRYLSGKPLSLYIAQDDLRDFRQTVNDLEKQRGTQEYEWQMQPRGGQPFDAALTVAPVHDSREQLIGLCWLVRDVSERKRVENLIRRLNVELEDRVAERTAQLEAANAVKDELLLRERRTQDQLTFLAEASAQLSSSLEYSEILRRFTEITVPLLADWCLIYMVQDDGQILPIVTAHSERRKEGLLEEMVRHFPPDADEEGPLMRVLQTGQAQVINDLPDPSLIPDVRSSEHAHMLRELGFRSHIIAPLTSRSRTFGVVALVAGASGRQYGTSEMALAVELAQRAAVALDNALLYAASQREIAQRLRAEQELLQQQNKVRNLNARLQNAMVETHHRVKNNLQIIASLVEMQTLEGKEYLPAGEFHRFSAHVMTLATVHDVLTRQAREDGAANFLRARPLLEKLLPILQRTAGERTITSEIADVRLTAQQGSTLGIIVNELISNAIKHGAGAIQVRFEPTEGGARLLICDEGPGFPPDFDAKAAMHTGLELVENLCRSDLHGTVIYGNHPKGGACVTVTIAT